MVIVAQPESQIRKRAGDSGIEAIPLKMTKATYHRSIPRLIKIIEDFDCDLVVTHGSTDSWAAGIAARLARRRPKLIRVRHNMFPVGRGMLSSLLYRYLPNKIITLTEPVRQTLIRDNGVNPGRIISIPTGVDLERFRPLDDEVRRKIRKEFGISEGSLLVGQISDVHWTKGYQYYLEAAAGLLRHLPDVYFLVVGRAGKRGRDILGEIVRDRGIEDKVIFTGFRDDIPQILSALDLMVFASYSEGQGTVLVEAQACEKAVVSTNIEPIQEVVVDGATGYLVPIKDSRTLAEKMEYLLKNESERLRMGRAGRERVRERFSLEGMIESLEKLYYEVVSSKG